MTGLGQELFCVNQTHNLLAIVHVQHKCCGLMKHVLKPYGNHNLRHYYIVETVYHFSTTQGAHTINITCGSCKQKLYHVNQPLEELFEQVQLHVWCRDGNSSLPVVKLQTKFQRWQ